MMKWPYPVGTNVKITPYGHEEYYPCRDNPKNTIGTVVLSGEEWTEVRWGNGGQNFYQAGTISPVVLNLDNI